MKGISYIVFNESQIREIIGDAIASIGCRIMRSDNFHSYDINFDDSNGLVIESIIRTVCLITASKSEIDPVVEQKIFEKIHDFAEDTNHIEIKKYRA